MSLRVNSAGNGIGEGAHVSVYLFLMKGPHDDELEQSGHWPLRGTFTIELLNQFNDSDHHIGMIQFHHYHFNEYTERVTGTIRTHANVGQGNPQFISHDTLLHHSNNSYHKNDFLIFRISYEHMEAPHQIAPITVKVTKFSYWLKSISEWYSSPFFAFEGGYQMYLKVDAAGSGIGEGTHVSVYLYLMKGPHDDELEQSGHWPLRGTFTIELLNQLNDSDHHSYAVKYGAFSGYHRVKTDKNVMIDAMPKFISHDTLLHHSNGGYHKSDLLIFRISYEHTEAPYQTAPITFKVTKLSYWLKSRQIWQSSPFFAFEGGYQMFLSVIAVSSVGQCTHVSVNLYLMKGPHDDELEQSGHWPLRGKFTIELLNQLNDSDHHKYTVKFGAFSVFQRVKEDESIMRHVDAIFISHNTLFQHNGYLRNDMLQFRMSYSASSDDNNGNQ